MAKIKEITAREIFNGKGLPTVEATVILSDNTTASASFPMEKLEGGYNASIVYDHDQTRFNGYGMLKTIEAIKETITPKIIGIEATKQSDIDRALIDLDGTQNKSRLGANALLPVSIAVAKAAAASSVLPLFLYLRQFLTQKSASLQIPIPLFTVYNGLRQEHIINEFASFLLLPATSKTFEESLQIYAHVFSAIQDIMKLNNLPNFIGSEGSYISTSANNYEILSYIMQAIDLTTHRLGYDVFLGLDVHANDLYKNQQYIIKDKRESMSSRKLIDFYQDLIRDFHILYLSDLLSQDDWEGWYEALTRFGSDVTVAGGDLIATNPYRLQMALDKKAVNSIVVKPYQVGTVLESLALVGVAQEARTKVIVGSATDETNDDFIADFAVAIGADYIQFGPMQQGEHTAKYNRLLQINENIKKLI